MAGAMAAGPRALDGLGSFLSILSSVRISDSKRLRLDQFAFSVDCAAAVN